MDQQLTSDGKPYGPIRFKQLVRECYDIARIIHTPYNEVLQMTPLERGYIIEFIKSDNERNTKMLEDQVKQTQSRKR